MQKQNLLVIDGHNFLFKSFSVPFKFNSTKGTPLHVITTFLKQIRKSVEIVEKEEGLCTHIAIAFDTEHSADTNKGLLPEYKANRKQDYSQDEDSPFHHIDNIKHMLKLLGITTFEDNSCEADDYIASLTKKFVNENKGKVFIASSDTDYYQLVNEYVKVIKLGRGEEYTILTPEYIYQELKISPENYILYKSLVGDPSDNIPGVPGIGKVKASKIINKLFEYNLEPFTSIIERNMKLIQLDSEIKCKIEIPVLALNREKLFMNNKFLFEECCF